MSERASEYAIAAVWMNQVNGSENGRKPAPPHEVRDMALRYHDAGFCVIPMHADGGMKCKSPSVPSWREYETNRPTRRQVENWFSHWDANQEPIPMGIGLICGPVSGGLELLDFDSGELYEPWSAKIPSELLSRLTIVQSPRKTIGYHVFYRCSAYCGCVELALPSAEELAAAEVAAEKDPVKKPGALIETRGHGGLFVAVGSHKLAHPSKEIYRHMGGPNPWEVQTITPEERLLLWQAAMSFDRGNDDEFYVTRAIQGEKNKDRVFTGQNKTEQRYNAQTEWSEILIPHGWTQVDEGDDRKWSRPGKPGATSATVIIAPDGEELLTVYSTDPEASIIRHIREATGKPGGMNKFWVYKRLNHKGDHSKACNTLEREWDREVFEGVEAE